MLRLSAKRHWPAIALALFFAWAVSEECSSAQHDAQKDYAQTTAYEKGDELPWWESSAVWTAIFTGLLTLSTSGLWIVTRTSANATRDSVKLLPALERAYVFLEGSISRDIRPLREGETSAEFNVDFKLRNHGKTPAVFTAIAKAASYRADSDPKMVDVKRLPISPELVLASGEIKEMGAYLVLTADEYRQALDGMGRIFLVGCAFYDDIFQAHHQTRFCYQFDAVWGWWSVCPDETLNKRT